MRLYSSKSITKIPLLVFLLVLLCSSFINARPVGALRELVARRTSNSKHWLNVDGTVTAEIHTSPIHYKGTDGSWKDIDTSLEPSEKTGFRYSSIKNRFKTHFADKALGWHDVDVNGLPILFSAYSASDAPSVTNGNVVTYSSVWPGVDIKYEVTPVGVKEYIVLNSRPTMSEFRFTIRPGSLRPVQSPSGGIDLVDATETVRVSIPAPFMVDATGQESTAIDMSWITSTDGLVTIILHPDSTWLSTASYPVTIDPTLEVGGSSNNGVTDCYYSHCESPYSNSVTYYNNNYLKMGYYNNTTSYHSFIWFDLSGLPSGAGVISSTMGLMCQSQSGYTVEIRDVLSNWVSNPSSIMTMPNLATSARYSFGWTTAGLKTVSVTQLVKDWAQTPSSNYGIELHCTKWPLPPKTPALDIWASSSESGAGPILSVTYDDTPPTMPVVTDDGLYTANSSIHASWSSSDPETGITEYRYAIGTSPTDPGSGITWTYTSSPQADCAVSLIDGRVYYFYVQAKNSTGMWSSVGVSDGITVVTPQDAEGRFSITDNPNGRWSYGYAPDLESGYTMTLYNTGTTQENSLQRWHTDSSTEPSVTHNPTDDIQGINDGAGTVWPANTTAISPGLQGEKSIIRWTAPASGTYLISARFWDITGGYTSTDVHVLQNGSSLFSDDITNHYDVPASADQPEQNFTKIVDIITTGETIDFAVGRGNDVNARDTTAVEIRVSLVADAGGNTPDVDHGIQSLLQANLNNDISACRSNIRWANNDTNIAYGDTFLLPAGKQWIVDTIRVWVVPEIPIAPGYYLGQHFESITLYTGSDTSALSSTMAGVFHLGSNLTNNTNITALAVGYPGGLTDPGGVIIPNKYYYQTANGELRQLWQIDFNNLNLTVQGGTTQVFAVRGVPRFDRLMFLHAVNSALGGWTQSGNNIFKSTDVTTGVSSTVSVDNQKWFGKAADGSDKGSDISVQVFAH